MAALAAERVAMGYHVLAAKALPVPITAAGTAFSIDMLAHSSTVVIAQALSSCNGSEDAFSKLSLSACPTMGGRFRRFGGIVSPTVVTLSGSSG